MDDRLAGDVFGFGFPVDDKEESQSQLAKYFPELQLYGKLGGKGARGGRLGRSSGGPAMQAFTAPVPKAQETAGATTQPTTQTTQQTNLGDLLNQSMQKFLDQWNKSRETDSKKPVDDSNKPPVDNRDLFQGQERVYKALNPNPQTPREAITSLYESKLGRTPAESEIQSWLSNPVFEDKGLTSGEWEQLNRGFESTPEYLKLKKNTPGSTYTVPTGGLPARTSEPASTPAPTAATPSAPAPVSPPAPTRSFTPENPNPQTPEEAVKYLYQTQLGRTPSSSEVSSWTANPVFADRGLDTNEWSQLIAGFQSSPEYASARR